MQLQMKYCISAKGERGGENDMRKAFLGLSVVLSLVLATPLVSAGACSESTSVEVSQDIEGVYLAGSDLYVYGVFHITNVGENPAVIIDIIPVVQARLYGDSWTNLGPTYVYGPMPLILAPGDTINLGLPGLFGLPYDKGTTEWTAYRNVVKIHLQNHPTGDRWFIDKLSFEVP